MFGVIFNSNLHYERLQIETADCQRDHKTV